MASKQVGKSAILEVLKYNKQKLDSLPKIKKETEKIILEKLSLFFTMKAIDNCIIADKFN